MRFDILFSSPQKSVQVLSQASGLDASDRRDK